MDHFRNESKLRGTHCLLASFVIQSVPAAAESPGALGLDCSGSAPVSHDKEGWAELLICKQLNSLEESGDCQSTIQDGASVGERLKNNGAAKETKEILFPQIPNSEQRKKTKKCNITKIIVRDFGAVLHEGKVHLEEAHRNRMRVTLRITWLLLSLTLQILTPQTLLLPSMPNSTPRWTFISAVAGTVMDLHPAPPHSSPLFILYSQVGICSESSNVTAPTTEANSTLAGAAGGATTVTIDSMAAQLTPKPTIAMTESMANTEAQPVTTSVDTVNKAASSTQQTATTVRSLPVTLSTALIATTTQLNSSAKISPAPASTSGSHNPQTTVIASTTTALTMAKAMTQATVPTGTNSPVSDQPLLTKRTGSNGGFKESTEQPGTNGAETITRNIEALTTVPSVEAMSKNTLTMSTARKEESNAGTTTATITNIRLTSTGSTNKSGIPERTVTSSQTSTAEVLPVTTETQFQATIKTTLAGTKEFKYTLSEPTPNQNPNLVALCKSFMSHLHHGTCTLRLQNNEVLFESLEITGGQVNASLVKEHYAKIKEETDQKLTDKKTLIAILASCGALLIMIIILGICVSHRRKPYNENQQHLTEELHTVENGYHDNPTLEVMEVQPEMQEKKVALNGEFSDSWIVPIDNLMKEDMPDEEDTHL
ncbi:hypothetical protein CRENBAI_018949 [Crenichthys baileyi]|uniref:Podocalyxin n=1 Tax=Crenichthys baileyi TaxID=28760 RepID=A0AAV9SBA5_9TELE